MANQICDSSAASFAVVANTIKGQITQKFTELGLENHPAILACPEGSASSSSSKATSNSTSGQASASAAATDGGDDTEVDESALDESVVEPRDWFVQQFNRNTTVLPSPKYKWCKICNRWLSKLTHHQQA